MMGKLKLLKYFIWCLFYCIVILFCPLKALAQDQSIYLSGGVVPGEEKVSQQVNKLAIGESLRIISNNTDTVSFEMSFTLFRTLIIGKQNMVMSTRLGETVFQPAGIDLERVLSSHDNPEDITVRFTWGRAEAQDVDKVNQAVSKAARVPVGLPVQLKIELVDSLGSVELQNTSDYVTHKILIPETVRPELAIGTLLKEDSSLAPTPTRFLLVQGRNLAIMKSRNLGVFTVVQGERTFSDVDDHWAREDIDLLASKLLVNGVGADCFAPDATITRAQFVTILARALGLMPDIRWENRYQDVKPGDWFYNSLMAIDNQGIIRGYPQSLFKPDEALTREQGALLAIKALEFANQVKPISPEEAQDILEQFGDKNQISEWAQSEVALAVREGLLEGITPSVFAPDQTCTRGEMVVILRRVLINCGMLSPSVIVKSPSDNLYTNQGLVKVEGRVKPDNLITINGEKLVALQDGTFLKEHQLFLGDNSITVSDTDELGNTEKVVRRVVYDITPPFLTIKSPVNKEVVLTQELMVLGYTEPGCAVTVNDTQAAVDALGNFRCTVTLELGANKLLVKAKDRGGNETSAKAVVFCSPNKISGFTLSPDPLKLGNPMNIRYLLEEDARVSLTVYSEQGDMVKILQYSTSLLSGKHSASWDGKDSKGELVPDGKYSVVAVVTNLQGDTIATRSKMMVAARVPEILTESYGLAVYSPNENQGVTLPYTLQSPSQVTIEILRGTSKIITLRDNESEGAGLHTYQWDGKDMEGNWCGDGQYTCVVAALSEQVAKFKAKAEFSFVIERNIPAIANFTANPQLFRINGAGLNIRYQLSERAKVTLKVRDAKGRLTVNLLKEVVQERGNQNLTWEGRDATGRIIAEGNYSLEISAVDNFGKKSLPTKTTITAGYQPVLTQLTFRPQPFVVGSGKQASIRFNLATPAVITVEIKVAWVTVKTLRIATLTKPGVINIPWDGSDNYGFLVGEGNYTLQITAVSPTITSFKTTASSVVKIKEKT